MPMILHAILYNLVALVALTWGGNLACQLLLRLSGMKAAHPVSNGADRAGHIIGWLERLIIALGLVSHSWEVLAAVIALKTISRFKDLDKTIPAEYFLIGSLFSVFWSLLIVGMWLVYDQRLGIDVRSRAARLISPDKPDRPAVQVRIRWDGPAQAPARAPSSPSPSPRPAGHRAPA